MRVSGRPIAVVTGATGGMGRIIALELARSGMDIVTVARDPHRAEALRDQIAETTRSDLHVINGDLSSREGIIAAAKAVRARHRAVHVLVNNAGAHYATHQLTPDGIERHIAVDFLASFGLTSLLEEQLQRGRARVVNVASDTLRDTRRLKLIGKPRPSTVDQAHLNDLATLNPAAGFVPFEAYARAKLLTVIAGYNFARQLDGEVTVNAVHPGLVATDIIDDLTPRALRPFSGLIRRALLTPEDGASAAIRLATDPALTRVTGRYFIRDVEVRTPAVTYDRDIQEQLHATSKRFLGGVSARP